MQSLLYDGKYVEDQHPLKQGLKPVTTDSGNDINLVEDQHPLKQGLKHDGIIIGMLIGTGSKTNIH